MTVYNFGVAISYQYYALRGRLDYHDLSGVTDNPAIYVFDEKPTREAALAGTGAIAAAITSWSNVTTNEAKGKTFTIPAIPDPEPNSQKQRKTYWLGINHVLVNGGTTQTIIRALPIERISAHHLPVSTGQADLQKIFQDVDSYFDSTEQNNAILQAIKDCEGELDARQFEWVQLWEPDDLNNAIAYKALSILARGEFQETGDRWDKFSEVWAEQYDKNIRTIRLQYAAHPENNEPAPAPKSNSANYIQVKT